MGGLTEKQFNKLEDEIALEYARSWVIWTPSNCDLRASKLNPDFWVSDLYKYASYMAQQMYAEEMGWV